eukprot:jgi/Tetstr1/449015/TSEL_036240.t1
MAAEGPLFQGSCLCGAAAFQVTGKPKFSVVCHCSTCQKWYGCPVPVIVGFPGESLLQRADESKLLAYRTSKDLVRFRCGTCGCPVYELADQDGTAHIGYSALASDSADGIASLTPTTHMFYGSAKTCVVDMGGDGRPKWASYPGVGQPM